MWYSAHAIFYFHQQQTQGFLVHENIYAISAPNPQDAVYLAQDIAKAQQDFNEEGHLELQGKPAQYVFAGIRKIIEMADQDAWSAASLPNGAELTYSEFELESYDQIKQLIKGEPVSVTLCD